VLDEDKAKLTIEKTALRADITFLPETIRAILEKLKYNLPEERNMMALQVVCRAVFQHALDLPRTTVTPELLSDLGGVEGILDREFAVATKLEQSMYRGGDDARKVLSQFVCSDGRSMRPRSWDELKLRCGMEKPELDGILGNLLEDGLVRPEQHPGEEKYELVHETLVSQINWLKDDEIQLRMLEEIVESAHTLIPVDSEKGGLKDLDDDLRLRDALAFSERQQALLLRSALEADHETKYWFEHIQTPQLALSVLTSSYLGLKAQESACRFLGLIGAQQGESGEAAKKHLWEWAWDSKSPRINQAASLALAPLVDAEFINQKLDAGDEGQKHKMIDALALMHDAHCLPLQGLPAAARRQVRLKLLHNNVVEIFSAVLRAAAVGAAGLGLAVVWNAANDYLGGGAQTLADFLKHTLELSLVGLLAFMIALPAALCAPLGCHLWALLAGGRRSRPAALGTLAGSTLGGGLTVAFLAALAELGKISLQDLSRYFLSGAMLGAAIGLPWLLTARWFSLKERGLVLLAGLGGGLAFFGLSQWEAGWPQYSFALTPEGHWLMRLVPGILIGLGSAAGLTWGRLRGRSP
jgi:hypothetical protein